MSNEKLAKSVNEYFTTGRDNSLFKNLTDFYELVQPFDKHETQLIALTSILPLINNANGTSSNLLITGTTGIGKDKLVSDTLLPFPNKHILEFEHVTKKTLTGLKIDFTNKILHLNDVTPSLFNEESYLSLTTRNKGETKHTVDYNDKTGHTLREVSGKPVIISTTNRLYEVKPDHYRRHTNLILQDSEERKKKRVNLLVDRAENPNKYLPTKTLQEQIKNLYEFEYDVKIPYANELAKEFLTQDIPTNFTSQLGKILDYIRAYTVMLNYDKPIDVTNNIKTLEATKEIYNDYVRPLITRVFGNDIQGYVGNTKLVYQLLLLSTNPAKKAGFTISELSTEFEERYGYNLKYETIVRQLRNLQDDNRVKLDFTRTHPTNFRLLLTAKLIDNEIKFPILK